MDALARRGSVQERRCRATDRSGYGLGQPSAPSPPRSLLLLFRHALSTTSTTTTLKSDATSTGAFGPRQSGRASPDRPSSPVRRELETARLPGTLSERVVQALTPTYSNDRLLR